METKPSEKCAICDVKAGSITRHYGVYACLGCKTFFRRAIVRKRRYFCEFDGNCGVKERSGRQSCRYCRLKKCYAVGMRVDALKGKRDAVGVRQSSVDSSSDSDKHSPPIYTSDNPLLTLITQLTRDDRELRQRKACRLHAMTEAMKLSRTVNNVIYPAYFGRDDLRMVDVIDMGCVTSGDMYALVEWAQTLPFFQKLPIDCRTNLLRRFAVYHLVVEAGYCTAKSPLTDIWLLPNGTCMPRDLKFLPLETQRLVTPDRAWRQEKLYRQMTSTCIDDVGVPMKKLQLLPEEFVTLKVIMFCQFGNNHDLPDESLAAISIFKNQVINALFEFYKAKELPNYEERFGNVLLLISGIVGAANLLHESYQIMRVFGIVPFDKLTNSLLFSLDSDMNSE